MERVGTRRCWAVSAAAFLHAGGRQILDRHLPDVKEALLRAGGAAFDYTVLMPPFITDRERREGDERFLTVTGRRPAIEYAFASAAEGEVPVVRGSAVAGLLTGPSAAKGTPHISGIRTANGRWSARCMCCPCRTGWTNIWPTG